jgi:hypothetical protein
MLDATAGVEGIRVARQASPLLDLQGASLDVPHPAPGRSVTISVPVHNYGLAPATLNGSLVVLAGGKTLGSAPVTGTLPANGSTTIMLTVPAAATAMTLQASGITASSTPELGLPATPTNLMVSVTSDGDMQLQWTAPKDSAIAGYNVYRKEGDTWTLVGLADGAQFVDPGMAGSTSTQYAVTTVDTEGRESLLSEPASGAKPGTKRRR